MEAEAVIIGGVEPAVVYNGGKILPYAANNKNAAARQKGMDEKSVQFRKQGGEIYG